MIRHKNKIRILSLISVTALATMFSACSGNNNGNASPSTSASGSESPSVSASASAGVSANDLNAKYDPPITITAAQLAESTWVYDSGDDLNNNVWTRHFTETLGINFKFDWTAAKLEDYTNKLNVMIGSGDKLPDMFQVDATQLQQLAEAGQLADLTEVFNKFASPLTKKLMSTDGGIGLSSATFDGKLVAIPNLAGTITANDVLWLRADWLKKVGLPEPKSIDDLVAIADAFVNKDPDGNGKKDTQGLGLATGPSLTPGDAADLGGFFSAYNVHPGMWVKDESGKVVYGGIQPGVKDALLKLQDMYKKGLIDKEWIVKDGGKIGEDIANNKLGMWYGANWNSYWPVNITSNKDLVNLKPYSLVSAYGAQPVVQMVNPSVAQFTVVKKGFEHPEAIVKLLNEFQEKMWGETSDSAKFGENKNVTPSITYSKYPLVQSWPMTKDIPDNLDAVNNAFSTGDTSKLNSEQMGAFDTIKAFNDGDIVKGFGNKRQFDAFEIIKKDNLSTQLYSEFYGAPTPTMITLKASLDKLEQETFTKIIMGKGTGDDFDKFVSDWNKLGGEAITKEVNEWKAGH
ncbi:extracellular solute-binding protein [Gorillibacterium massiliense]|uniref:extracellular solute-binding protein n=1 Tax=Gorillibacterium massiliense TaxID=1280390 RepID=UPI0004AE237D|nr:extracellular solute-binding protein [Gorillibacterium massiliense]